MIISLLRVMVLNFVRDRGALVLAFVIPPVIFVIFATIFAATSSDEPPLKISFGRSDSAEVWDRFETALRHEPTLRVLASTAKNQADVSRQVERGFADVGLFIRGNPQASDAAPVIVLVEASKPLAGAILVGQVQALVARRVPDLGLSRTIAEIEPLIGLTSDQSAQLKRTVAELATGSNTRVLRNTPGLVEQTWVGGVRRANAAVSYYAGAVAILFLLFSALQSAAVLIEERNSGILDRIAVVPNGPQALIYGKFLFLVTQGFFQASLIFAAAALYNVNILDRFGLWLLVTLVASMAVSGLALAVAATCSSRQQASTVSILVVLVCSAVGGSMLPRFLMPEWLQDVGKFTPNAWVIEAYQDVLWRGEAASEVMPELVSLGALAVFGTVYAVFISRRRLEL